MNDSRRAVMISMLSIMILGLAAYWSSLDGQFIWDDDDLIKDNVFIKNWKFVPRIFTSDEAQGAGRAYGFYRPFHILSIAFDYHLWRLNVKGYHSVNTLLHILTALCVYFLSLALFRNNIISILAGILFVVHPVQTETVMHISSRVELLSSFFMLISFLLYIKEFQKNKLTWYLLMFLCYLAAVLSQENALMLPVILLLYHFTFRVSINYKKFLSIFIIAFLSVPLRMQVLSSYSVNGIDLSGVIRRLPGLFVALDKYINLFIAPKDLHMYYGRPLFSFSDPKVLFGVASFLSILLLMVIAHRKKWKLVFFSLGWFLITMLPVSNIYPLHSYVEERYLYFPSIGLFLIAAYLLSLLLRRDRPTRPFAIAAVAVLVACYSFLTEKQSGYWKNPSAFFERTARYNASDAEILLNLGMNYKRDARYEEAEGMFKRAIASDPLYVKAYEGLGSVYVETGRHKEAARYFKKALSLDPGYIYLYNDLGSLYARTGEYRKAVSMYEAALRLNKGFLMAYYNLATTYLYMGQVAPAVVIYHRIIDLDPDYAAAHAALTMMYYDSRQYEKAAQYYDRAVKLGHVFDAKFVKAVEPYRKK